MTRDQLKEKVEKLMEVLENTQRTLSFTNIPVHVLIKYIKDETGIDLNTEE